MKERSFKDDVKFGALWAATYGTTIGSIANIVNEASIARSAGYGVLAGASVLGFEIALGASKVAIRKVKENNRKRKNLTPSLPF